MSYVDALKEKHRFEESLCDLLRYLSAMTIEELELAMAHIADDVVSEPVEASKINGLVKGAALQTYLGLRADKQIQQRKLQRVMFRGEMKEYFAHIGTVQREVDVEERDVHAKRLQASYEIEMEEYRRECLEWTRTRDALPFFKRLLGGGPKLGARPMPQGVPYPPGLSVYIARAQSMGTMEEFLVSVSRNFELLPLPSTPIEFSPQEIALLCQRNS
jgi:hypothetical protein